MGEIGSGRRRSGGGAGPGEGVNPGAGGTPEGPPGRGRPGRAPRGGSPCRARWGAAAGATLLAALVLTGCGELFTEAPDDGDLLDAPLPGLTGEELKAFVRGDEEFGRAFAPSEGLGPVFNDIACAACHSGDGRGGPGNVLLRFGEPPDLALSMGGPQLQTRAIPGAVAETLPDGYAVSRRLPPPVFGVGLIEAIPVAAILALADPDDADGDGVSGRPHWVLPPEWVGPGEPGGPGPDGRALGRFSRKAQVSTLLQQITEAYHQDMGITSDLLPVENVNPLSGPHGRSADRVADPEIPESTVRAVLDYVRMLAPPRPGDETPEVARGRALFGQVGCARCHVPVLRTGAGPIGALAFRDVHLYSDLLLHDLGPELSDGRRDGDATGGEWRTAPLWGLRVMRDFLDGQAYLLHDGRAASVEEAVRLHGGEAEGVRAAFLALPEADRQVLLRFVESR